ncbi:MAG: substrate-binding domain-containing protein [Gammaproteobacteria bacterium]|nr:substrate-binding domain-containing protein [Gammaproteobacteria bacterium]
MKSSILVLITSLLVGGAGLTAPARADDASIVVQSTTSTQNSGLYGYLLPLFKADTGITVHVVAVGTGQAINNARNCDGDVLLVHAKSAEQDFVSNGYGVARFDLMYNDFVIVGPPADPAGIGGGHNAVEALKKIAGAKALFASRGDNSGTHKKELALWKESGIDPTAASGQWYRETGSGMGATLNAGIGMSAYVLTDRATWISFANKGFFVILVEGDKALFNQYGVILVNPEKCPTVRAAAGQRFVDWLLSAPGQRAIGEYRRGGKQLFFPNAAPR